MNVIIIAILRDLNDFTGHDGSNAEMLHIDAAPIIQFDSIEQCACIVQGEEHTEFHSLMQIGFTDMFLPLHTTVDRDALRVDAIGIVLEPGQFTCDPLVVVLGFVLLIAVQIAQDRERTFTFPQIVFR